MFHGPITYAFGAWCSNGRGWWAVSYLTPYLDLALEVREGESADSLLRAEVERLRKLLAVARAAQTIPRRIGPEATSAELALDKQRARRVQHVAEQSLRAWGSSENGTIEAAMREAAAVDWLRWFHEHRIWLMNRQRYVATWAYKTGANEKWAKSTVVKLGNELKWLEYALR